VPNVESIRHAIAYAIGALEVSLGYKTAEDWIEIMKAHPLQQVNAMYLRRILAIYAEDREAAESYRKQAEVLAVQASARQMFDIQLLLELAAHVHARDLTGIKQTADRIEQLAAKVPGWMPQHHLAQAYYQRLRGDLPAAKEAFERAIALVDPNTIDPPPNLNVWVNAAGAYSHALVELGRPAEAREFALKARAICEARGIPSHGWASHIERALGLAEAKLGDFESARRRLDQLIERRSNLLPARLSIDYEVRARVAILEKDTSAARHFAGLAAGVGFHAARRARARPPSASPAPGSRGAPARGRGRAAAWRRAPRGSACPAAALAPAGGPWPAPPHRRGPRSRPPARTPRAPSRAPPAPAGARAGSSAAARA